jgi:hypothetical protein
LWIATLLLFVAGLAFFTRDNGFPYYYHPDEPGKVKQVIEGRWNFHHPLLMLGTAKVSSNLLRVPNDEQRIVGIGRLVSATFAAVGITAFALLAWRWKGSAGFLCAGALLLTHHQVFELAHYFKEDTALLAGISLTLLTANWVDERRTPFRIGCLGAATALAISGKYAGVVVLAVTLPVLCAGERPNRLRDVALYLGITLLFLAGINFPLLLDLITFRESFGRELGYVVHGQRGMTRSVPHSEALTAFRENSTPVIWILLGVFLWRFWGDRRRHSLSTWLITLFPIAWMLLLSFSPKANDRYFLPATAAFTFLAATGIVDAASYLKRHVSQSFAVAILLAIALTAQLVSFPDPLDWKTTSVYMRAFAIDDRAELRAWLESNTPAEAVIAQDSSARLTRAPLNRLVLEKAAAEIASLDELRARGVSYVVVSDNDFGRYFRSSHRPKKGYADEFEVRRRFYEQLFGEGELLWSRRRSAVIYLHPGLRVYRIK